MKKLLLAVSIFLSSPYFIEANQPDVQEENENTEQQNQPDELNELDTLEQENIDEIARDIGIIRFTITLYKDRNDYDEMEWRTIITKAAQSMYRLQNEQEADRNDILKELNQIIDALESNQFDTGIGGELTVEASDGQPIQDCCGENCKCFEMYRGNCPCSLNNTHSNRCLFPQEMPFDDQYEQDETSSDTDEDSDENSEDSFKDVDLNKGHNAKNKRCCS